MNIYVAVVDSVGGRFRSRRPEGDYAAFIGDDRDDVIKRALVARQKWGCERYRVLVGELIGEAREPVQYEVVPISGRADDEEMPF